MSGEMASNVWSFAENGLQGLEIFAKHASNVWRFGENGLQRLEGEKLKSPEVEKLKSSSRLSPFQLFTLSTFHPVQPAKPAKHASNVWRNGENALQRLELFPVCPAPAVFRGVLP